LHVSLILGLYAEEILAPRHGHCLPRDQKITTRAQAYDWGHNSSIDLLGTRRRITK
jgi:hypothetical protein